MIYAQNTWYITTTGVARHHRRQHRGQAIQYAWEAIDARVGAAAFQIRTVEKKSQVLVREGASDALHRPAEPPQAGQRQRPQQPGELTYVLTLDTLNGRDAEHLTHVTSSGTSRARAGASRRSPRSWGAWRPRSWSCAVAGW